MAARALLTTNVVGGLGNQLFLVANLLATAHRTGIPAFLEPAAVSSSAEAPRPTYWSTVFRDLARHGVRMTTPANAAQHLPIVPVPEMRPVHRIELDPQRACVYSMVGFFQCEAFFDDHPVLHSVIPADLWQAGREHLHRHYKSGDAASCHTVGLHIRRGDYTRFRDVFEQLEVDYYDAAVRQLLGGLLHRSSTAISASSASRDIRLLVFCDDERVGLTVAGYFQTKYKGLSATLVSARSESTSSGHEELVSGSSSAGLSPDVLPREVLELLMMAQCNDVVMANSTYSWWGAYLNRVPLRRVVAPSRWFVKDPYPRANHLYCPGWVLI